MKIEQRQSNWVICKCGRDALLPFGLNASQKVLVVLDKEFKNYHLASAFEEHDVTKADHFLLLLVTPCHAASDPPPSAA